VGFRSVEVEVVAGLRCVQAAPVDVCCPVAAVGGLVVGLSVAGCVCARRAAHCGVRLAVWTRAVPCRPAPAAWAMRSPAGPKVMRDRFTGVIEHATGRPVIGFISGNQQHPDMMCEVFILGPSDLVDEHEVHDASGGSALPA